MSSNPHERAVIEAARSLVSADRMAEVPPAGTPELRIHQAVRALDAYERTQRPATRLTDGALKAFERPTEKEAGEY